MLACGAALLSRSSGRLLVLRVLVLLSLGEAQVSKSRLFRTLRFPQLCMRCCDVLDTAFCSGFSHRIPLPEVIL